MHFLRNAQTHGAKSGRRLIAAFIGTAFAQETPEAAHREWRRVSDQLRDRLPKLSQRMDEAEMDVLAYGAEAHAVAAANALLEAAMIHVRTTRAGGQ